MHPPFKFRLIGDHWHPRWPPGHLAVVRSLASGGILCGLEPLANGDSNSSNGLYDGGYQAVKYDRDGGRHLGMLLNKVVQTAP